MKAKFHLIKSGEMIRTYIAKPMLDADGKQVKRAIAFDQKTGKLAEEIPANLPVFTSFADAKEQLCDCVIRIVNNKYTLAEQPQTPEQLQCLREYVSKFQKQTESLCVVSTANRAGIWLCELNSENGHCRFVEPVLSDAMNAQLEPITATGVSKQDALKQVAIAVIDGFRTSAQKIAEKELVARAQPKQVSLAAILAQNTDTKADKSDLF